MSTNTILRQRNPRSYFRFLGAVVVIVTLACVSNMMVGSVAILDVVSQYAAITTTAEPINPIAIEDSSQLISSVQPHESPLLVFTCNQAEHLQQTLAGILRYIPADCSIGCPIVISQDGKNAEVLQVITDYQTKFAAKGIPVVRIEHKSALRGGTNAYQALAVHYGWALGHIFNGSATRPATASPSYDSVLPQRVVILEEDLHVAPDFFTFFAAMAPVLDRDRSLFAVSAFNDNGFRSRIKDNTRILRSDFFPGLGWMMTRKLWTTELQAKWPGGYWDDWLRDPEQRKGRHVLRPEVSRSFHFGTHGGASMNQFGSQLTAVMLNPYPVEWQEDFSHLLPDEYDRKYWAMLQHARRVESMDEVPERVMEGDVRLEYTSFGQFQILAKKLQLMADEKAGIPRTAYKGVVETRPFGENLLFLTPPLKDLQKEFVTGEIA